MKVEMRTETSWMDVGSIGNLDIVLPDAFIEHEDYLYLGPNKYCRCIGVTGFPYSVYVGIFSEYSKVFGEWIDSTTLIEHIDSRKAMEKYNEEMAILQSNFNIQYEKTGLKDYAMERKIQDYDELRYSIQTGTERMAYIIKIFRIWGDSLEDINKKTRLFQNMCDRKAVMIRTYIYQQKEAFLNTLPYGIISTTDDMYKKNVTSSAVAGMFPSGFSGINHPNGIYLGKTIDTNAPIIYDRFVGPPELENQMMAIFGTMGAGKSVTEKVLKSRSLAQHSEWSVSFDVEGESKRLIEEKLGGKYIEFEPGKKTGINPFDVHVEKNQVIDIYGKVGEIRDSMKMFMRIFAARDLTEEELVGVEVSVKELYSERGISKDPQSLYEISDQAREGLYSIGKRKKTMPMYTDLKGKLYEKGYTKLATSMEVMTGDGSMAIFDCQTTLDLKPGAYGFGFKKITDETLKFYAIVSMLSWTWSLFGDYQYKHINKSVYIDETWVIVKYKISQDYLEHLLRRGRKYAISLVLSSQLIIEYLQSEVGNAIIQLCSTVLIMKQNTASQEQIGNAFGLSYDVSRSLGSFSPGDGVLISGNRKVLIHVDIFDFEREYVLT